MQPNCQKFHSRAAYESPNPPGHPLSNIKNVFDAHAFRPDSYPTAPDQTQILPKNQGCNPGGGKIKIP